MLVLSFAMLPHKEMRLTSVLQLAFVNNMIGNIFLTWSVAVEFQFYLISPYIIYALYRTKEKRIWILPIAIFLISTVLNVFAAMQACP